MHRIIICSCLLLAWLGDVEASPPNVVVILTDDQGWGDLSLHGNPNLSTPHIDSLARSGAQIRHFYVCAVCSPTRAEFLTGRYHTRTGVYSTSSGGERFNADEQTIAEVFRGGGYATAAYGKWHSGMQYPYHPNARGFDDYYGFCSGHWGHYFSPMLEHNGRIVQGNGFLVDDLTDHALQFISESREEPFFVYLPLNTPHSPMQVPGPYWDRFKDKAITADPAPANAKKQNLIHTRAALAMCENIDANVGRLLAHLEALKLSDNTIVVFFCDNGPNGSRFNGGMRGRKGSTFEGGLRSPCLIRYPGKIEAGTKVTEVGAAIDLLPTLADLAGLKVHPVKPLDGVSLAPLLLGDPADWPDRLIFSAWNGKASVRSDRYRMQASGELFDLQSDPGENQNIAQQHRDVAKRLSEELQAWIAETHPRSSRSSPYRPFTLGHPEAEYTQLPARDAVPHGKIIRSNKFPNCTFMTQWNDASSEITWDVEVLSEGDYEVQMYYAAKNAGSEIQLSLGPTQLAATIDEAHDVPLVGREQDRFERAEGYVRRWRPMTLGTMHLQPGAGTLRLRATKVVGTEVAEMRLLMFRKI
jgi:arylsulfatase A-like enzyme